MSSSHGIQPACGVSRLRASIRRTRIVVIVAAIVLNLAPRCVSASGVTTVDVLIEDRARVTGLHLAGALATAERLFRTSGVRLAWRRNISEHLPQLTIVLSSGFDLRLKASLEARHVGVFLRSAQRAYVMYDRVVVLGREYQTDAATVLGWALAHEIGHFLLGDVHAPLGVMAAQLTPTGLLDEPFSAAERAAIQANATTLPMLRVSELAGHQPAAASPIDRTD